MSGEGRALAWYLCFAVGFAALVIAYGLVIIALGILDSFGLPS